VPAWNAFSYVFGPLMAFGGLAVLVLLLRWAFGRGGSLIERPPDSGSPDRYGLLVPVAAPVDRASGERLQHALTVEGVRATLADTTDGPRLLVFATEVEQARALLRGLRESS